MLTTAGWPAPRWTAIPVLALSAAALLTGCGTDTSSAEAGRTTVVAGFYPLQYAAERVGGDRVSVTNLAAPGVEPHDLELTPGDLRRLNSADLVLNLPGFQPALDAALSQDGRPSLDVSSAARLDLTAEPGHDEEHESHEGHGAHESDGSGDGSSSAVRDPHFWLDPLRLADVGDAIAGALASQDAAHAEEFRGNARALRAELMALDGEYQRGLAQCRSRDLVTSHEAFGYLAERYQLRQRAISGLRPESEPSPADLITIQRYVQESGVRTIYNEVLVPGEVGRTVAAETGARVAVLDPIEGLAANSKGDYLSLMRQNLATLRSGQKCT